MNARVVVVGVGNLLARDDGIGPRVIRCLQDGDLPPDVACVDAATDFLSVLPELAGAARLIVVDAMRGGGPPGTLYRMSLEDLESRARAEPLRLSLHDAALVESVRMARLAGWTVPPTTVLGLEPAEVGLGTELSPVVQTALELLLKAVWNEIG